MVRQQPHVHDGVSYRQSHTQSTTTWHRKVEANLSDTSSENAESGNMNKVDSGIPALQPPARIFMQDPEVNNQETPTQKDHNDGVNPEIELAVQGKYSNPEEDTEESEHAPASDKHFDYGARSTRGTRIILSSDNDEHGHDASVVANQQEGHGDQSILVAVEDETLSNLQQHGDANVGLFGWFKAEKSRIYFGIAFLVLLVVVIVVGVAVGLSISGGGSSNTSQTDTSGPTASPLPSVKPVTTDVPTPTATASPEATLNPTPPLTVDPTTPDPAPSPTTSPTPPPTPPPTLPPTPLVPGPTPPPTVTNIPVSPTRELIQNVSVALNGGAALQNTSSPQSLALEWLEGNANLPTYSDTQKIQRFALASLYHSTNGAQWYEHNSGWLSDDPECEWGSYSNTPCADGQLINDLLLYYDNLSGSIPPELALLSNSLDSLRLHNNHLGGSIPSELGLLSNLEKMWLYINDITGRIPTEVGLLSKMTDLSLSRNALTGAIPTVFNSMTNLDYLYLYGNNFTGEFECPDFISTCLI